MLETLDWSNTVTPLGWALGTREKCETLMKLFCVFEASAVGEISDCYFGGPGWSKFKLWATFFHRNDRGQGR